MIWIAFPYLLVSVLSCNITFTNTNNGRCVSKNETLQCTITNPNLTIETNTCQSNFKTIIFQIDDIETLDELFSDNQQTIESLYELFKGKCDSCVVKIELTNLTSKSEISIDKQWISQIIREEDFTIHDRILSISLNIIDNDWTKINLTINKDINSIIWIFKSLQLFLSDNQSNCSILYTYIRSEINDQVSQQCSKFVKITESIVNKTRKTSTSTSSTLEIQTQDSSLPPIKNEQSSNIFSILLIILPIGIIILKHNCRCDVL